jgi:diguanylate cyclase (GGDEF)-like protein
MERILKAEDGPLLEKRFITLIWIIGALMAIAVTWAAVFIKIHHDLQELRSRGTQRVTNLAFTYAEQVQRTVREIDQIALTVKYQWQTTRTSLNLVDQYEKAMHQTPTYPAAIGVDGKIKTSWREQSIGLDFGKVEFFDYHRTFRDPQLHISALSNGLGGLSGKKVIRFTRRVDDSNGNFDGVVLVSTEPAYLASLDYHDRLNDGDFISLRLTDGQNLVTRTANQIENHDPYFFSYPQFESSAGSQLYDRAQFQDDLGRYVAWKKIKDYPLVALAAVTDASIIKSYNGTKNAYLLFAIINTALILLVATFGRAAHIKSRERRAHAEKVRTTFRLAVEGAQEAFYMISPVMDLAGHIHDYRIEDCNERAAIMNGMTPSTMIGKNFSEIYDESNLGKLLRTYNHCYSKDFMESKFYVKENSRHQAGWFLRRTVRSGDGIAVTIRDITAEKLAHEAHIKLAFTDSLTGLHNRRWLNEYLPDALKRAEISKMQLALLFIDLDNFKKINDTLGHAAGDDLLIAAANCIKEAVRSVDHVVRLGGDEFTIILENQENESGAELIAQELLRCFEKSDCFISWRSLNVKCSVGVALFPTHAEDASSLLRCADEAMYAAKEDGKGCYRVFNLQHYGRDAT